MVWNRGSRRRKCTSAVKVASGAEEGAGDQLTSGIAEAAEEEGVKLAAKP